MHRVLFALVLVGCSSGADSTKPAAGSGSARAVPPPRDASTPTAPDGTGYPSCDLGARVADKLKCPAINPQDLAMTQKAFRAVASAAAQAKTEPAKIEVACEQMVVTLDHSVKAQGCSLDLTTDERAKLDKDLAAYFALRTEVKPTGNAEADEVIARAAALRDKMCECDTMACAAGIDGQLDTIGHLPENPPAAASTLANKLVDDIGRCESRIKLATGTL